MRRREKNAIVLVTVLIVVILGLFALFGVVPRQQKVFAVAQPAQAVQIVSRNAEPYAVAKVYKQQADLDKLNHLVAGKTATRVFSAGLQRSFEPILSSDYDKENGYLVDAQGRVMFFVDKGDIRNQSRLHWLWWKINSLYDIYSAVAYVTDPDPEIAKQAKMIVDKAN